MESIVSSAGPLDRQFSTQDTIFILDESYSMAGRFVNTNPVTRMAVLRDVMTDLLTQRRAADASHKDKISIVEMGKGSLNGEFEDARLAFKLGSVSKKMFQFVSGMSPNGGTPFSHALTLAVRELDNSTADLAKVVLLTDGDPTCDSKSDQEILAYAEYMFDDCGIILDVIGIGSSGMSGSDYRPAYMADLARRGGGEFIEADSPESLKKSLFAKESERRGLLGSGMLLLPASTTEV